MKTHQLQVKLKSSFATLWQADTIFGHLCWVIAHHEGEDRLKDFLNLYRGGKPPFILSNGFPGDLLPAPANLPLLFPGNDRESFRKRKDAKRLRFLSLPEFNRLLNGYTDSLLEKTEGIRERGPVAFSTIHSQINRMSGTTQEGALYELPEMIFDPPILSIYIKVAEGWEKKVLDLFEKLSASGYGKKKSSGKGAFVIEDFKEFNAFLEPKEPNGFISLSNFVPGSDDPTEGFYETFIKYGKLGEELAFSANPFKKPILFIKEGAVFRTDSPLKSYYGTILSDVSTLKGLNLVQYALAFVVGISLRD